MQFFSIGRKKSCGVEPGHEAMQLHKYRHAPRRFFSFMRTTLYCISRLAFTCAKFWQKMMMHHFEIYIFALNINDNLPVRVLRNIAVRFSQEAYYLKGMDLSQPALFFKLHNVHTMYLMVTKL